MCRLCNILCGQSQSICCLFVDNQGGLMALSVSTGGGGKIVKIVRSCVGSQVARRLVLHGRNLLWRSKSQNNRLNVTPCIIYYTNDISTFSNNFVKKWHKHNLLHKLTTVKRLSLPMSTHANKNSMAMAIRRTQHMNISCSRKFSANNFMRALYFNMHCQSHIWNLILYICTMVWVVSVIRHSLKTSLYIWPHKVTETCWRFTIQL